MRVRDVRPGTKGMPPHRGIWAATEASRLAVRTGHSVHIGYVTQRTYEVFYTGIVEDAVAWLDGSPVRAIAG